MSHADDLIGDYAYLGTVFRWGPSQIDELPWSVRKRLIDEHKQASAELRQTYGK